MAHDSAPPRPGCASSVPSWEAVSALFAEALDVPDDERAGWLAARVDVDVRVMREVESLLAALERAGAFLDDGGR